MFVHLALLYDEMYEFLISAVVCSVTPVGQQPLRTPADFFLRLDDALLLEIVGQQVRCLVAADG